MAKILVIDDDFLSIKITQGVLDMSQHEITAFNHAVDALDWLQFNTPSVILVDYDMPIMNGLEFLAASRKDHPLIPVIMITGYANIDILRKAWYIGAFDFLTKPIDGLLLNEAVSLAINFGHLEFKRPHFCIETRDNRDFLPEPGLVNMKLLSSLNKQLGIEVVSKILRDGYSEMARVIEKIELALMVQNPEQVNHLIHKLKGFAANCGFSMVEFYAMEMEKICGEDPLAVEPLVGEVRHALEKSYSSVLPKDFNSKVLVG